MDKEYIHIDELKKLNSQSDLIEIIEKKEGSAKKVLERIEYEQELEKLQIELVRLQRWVQENDERIVILFEGRDAAGKGGAIRRFIEHLNPRAMRVVALPKPTTEEKGQWYFQRYVQQLPNEGEIVFFDRSWYNRAVVEPVNGFCSEVEYERFLTQVPVFENMLREAGITLIKFWFSISKNEQEERFQKRRTDPLKQWKISPIDEKAQELWDDYTHYKEAMFARTHSEESPWVIVKADGKKKARLESIRHVLKSVPYSIETGISLDPDVGIISKYASS